MTFFSKNIATTSWKLLSSVQRLTSSSYLGQSWYFRNFTVSGTTSSYVDANMLVDLTSGFDSGNEITSTSLLDKIPYFETTMSVLVKSVSYASTYSSLPTPTRSGYTFSGWYTAASGGSKVTNSTVVSGLSDHVLYARWS